MPVLARTFALVCAFPLAIAGAQLPQAPVAKIVPHVDTLQGDVLSDNYFWMRDRKDPDLISWLERENAYTAAMTKHTAELQEKIYQEIVGRIKETDQQVPEKRGPYFYYSRTEKGKSYPIFARKHGTLDAPEEVYFDQNAMAEGRKFYSLGGFSVSPDHRLLAVLVDTTGYEDFELQVKDLRAGRFLEDTIRKLGFGSATSISSSIPLPAECSRSAARPCVHCANLWRAAHSPKSKRRCCSRCKVARPHDHS